MGLDMYLYKATKTKDINSANFELRDSLYREDPQMYDDILPYCDKAIGIYEYIDTGKLLKDKGIEKTCGYFYRGDDFGIVKENGEEEVFSYEWLRENGYVVIEEELTYYCNLEEIAYWRKAYDTQELFYDYIGHVENCGYYKIDPEFLSTLSDLEEEDFSGDEPIFYHEWY